MKSLLCFVTLLISSQFASAQWIKQTVDTTASFRGLSVVSEKVVWASGTGGTVIQTIDGGKSWKVMQVADAAKLDFRDIEAFDANTAYILSIGNGESSYARCCSRFSAVSAARLSTDNVVAARDGLASAHGNVVSI